MKPNVKNILIVGTILALLILVLVRLSSRLHTANTLVTQNTQTPSVAESEPPLPFGQITRDEAIKHVEWAYRNGKPYEQFALTKDGPKDYVVTFYQPNPRDENIPYNERRGGILVFHISDNKPVLVWESKDDITLTRPTIGVRDITKDGKIEIMATWSDGTIDNLFIYSWTGNEFTLISPTTVVKLPFSNKEATGYIFDIRRGDIQVKDLDGDNIDEVTISGGVTRDKNDNEIPIIGREEIFKWNGTKYYLWKTVTEKKVY